MRIPAIAVLFALALPGGAQTNDAPTTLLQRMERIIIPAVEFREANAMDVLNFLFEAATVADPDDRSPLGLIHPHAVEPPRTIHVFETADGTSLEIPPFSFNGQHLNMLQAFDLICARAGLRFTMEHSGPVLFLPDGRRLLRKEIPAPPSPPLLNTSEYDEWGFGEFDNPIPVKATAVDWKPLLQLASYRETMPDALVSALEQMGFTCMRHKGGYTSLIDESGTLSSGLQPLDFIQGDRQDEAGRWIVQGYISKDSTLRGMAVFPSSKFAVLDIEY